VDEEIVDTPGKDGNASMPEQVKRPNPWGKMMMMMIIQMCVIAKKRGYGTDYRMRNYECKALCKFEETSADQTVPGKAEVPYGVRRFSEKNVLITAKFSLLAFTNNLIIHSERARVYCNKK